MGIFTIDAHTVLIVAEEADERLSANFFNDYLQRYYGLHLAIASVSRLPPTTRLFGNDIYPCHARGVIRPPPLGSLSIKGYQPDDDLHHG